MLCVTDLVCSRGGRPLFRPLGFSLAPGQWLQVAGDNGAGKTTLLRTLVGLSTPERGHIRWAGRDIRQQPSDYRRALCFIGHQGAVKDEFTPLENLRAAAALDGCAVDEAECQSALNTWGLAAYSQMPTRLLSAGQKRRVLLSRLLLRPARLWVLDEPFVALDGAAVDGLGRLLTRHLAGGGLVLLSSHQPVPLPAGERVVL